MGRLVSPRSELATHFWLQNNTALDELMGTNFNKLSLGQLYHISDKLLNSKVQIESHLALRETDLFELDNTIVLYDLTNTYLEGTACKAKKPKRGRSKEKRYDCPLVCLGLALNQQGFPRRSHIHEGNVSEPGTLQKMITELSESEDQQSVIVFDAGIASEENLIWLREQKRPYIVCSRNRSSPPEDFEENYDFIQVKGENTVKATLVRKDDESGEVELFCHSTAREQKETAIKSLFQIRFEEELSKVNEGLSKKGCTKNFEKVLEKIGRLKERYRRVARFYEINVEKKKGSANAKSVTFTLDQESLKDRYSGVYCLRCWGLDWKAEKLWKDVCHVDKSRRGVSLFEKRNGS